MEKRFFIFIGRSGAGKGVQSKLLEEYLAANGLQNIRHITTGASFREFIEGDSYTATLARYVNDNGLLQPEFLAVWNWSSIFINSLHEDESIILDGAPRKVHELEVLHSAISFFGFEKPTVIYVDVSEGCSRERLKLRGRNDDLNDGDVERRMSWFETDVLSVVENYKNDPRYTFIHVNGEQEVDEVHEDIIEKLTTLG